jgi:hypothetical protein
VDQCRALNIGICSLSQQPSSLLKSIINNSWLKVAFHLGSGSELKIVKEALGLNDEQAEYLHYLEVGEAIVRTAEGHLDPYPVKFNKFIESPKLSNRDFEFHQKRITERLYNETIDKEIESFTPYKKENNQTGENKTNQKEKDINQNSKTDKTAKESSYQNKDEKESNNSNFERTDKASNKSSDLESLISIWLNLPKPFLIQKQIMEKAEVKSGSKQIQLKNNAVREGLIIIHKLQKGRTYTSVWEPTDLAYESIDLNKPSYSSKGGYLHQFIAHHVTLWAKKNGLKAQIEFLLSNGKAIDVMIKNTSTMTFFEIVVSKPYEKELNNIEKDLATVLQPDKLIFLVTDNKVKQIFSKMLNTSDIYEKHKSIIEIKLAGDFIAS